MVQSVTYVSNVMGTKSDFKQNSKSNRLHGQIRIGAMFVFLLVFFQLSAQTTLGPLAPETDVSINNSNGIPHSNANICQVKSGNTVYIKYDLTGITDNITSATLDIVPASWGGPAVFKVSTGTDTSWSATNTTTLPTAVTELTTYTMAQAWTAFTVDLGAINASEYSSGTLNLIVEYVSGSTVGFARVGNTNPGTLDAKVPKLTVTYTSGSSGGTGAWTQTGSDLYYTSGNVGIGTTNVGTWKLAVGGKIRAEEIKVETGWADYVFQEGYDLPTLEEVQQHIDEKGHLINIPSAAEVAANGVALGEMNKLLLEKIEELTLYTLQQENSIEELTRYIIEINKELEELRQNRP